MIYFLVMLGGVLGAYYMRDDKPMSPYAICAAILIEFAFIAFGTAIAWLHGRDIVEALLLIDIGWVGSGGFLLPFIYASVLALLLKPIFRRKQ